jgi:DNA-binding LytR/AlgR family response regulator
MKEKILVIEDEKFVRENVSELLKEEGYEVIAVRSGEDGINKAKAEKPTLIICDIMMQGVDGYKVLEELSHDKSTRTIPFIFLTAKVEKDDIRRGMQLGADDYIFKPFKAEELLSAIETRIKKIQIFKADSGHNEPRHEQFQFDDKLFLTVKGKPFVIKISEIEYITAENQYTSIKLIGGDSFLIRKSIKIWEEKLPKNTFFKIHRSTIINLNFVVKMEKWYNSAFLIFLKNIPEPFVVSKKHSSKFRKNSV